MENENIFYMQQAFLQAQQAFAENEVPVGAVVVYQKKIIGKGYNQVEKLRDATAHAEILAMSAAYSYLDDWRLCDAILYTTLEPCIMCAGAIMQSRIKKVVWGAKDIRLGANGSFVDLFSKKHPMHQVEIIGDVLAQECAELMKVFFQQQRKNKKNCCR